MSTGDFYRSDGSPCRSISSSVPFCQVASLTILDKKLYVGTSWGCLIVADAHTMRPISVFRPFSEEIQAIIPISTAAPPPDQGSTSAAASAASSSSSSLIVTLGKGYRR